jgi:hypothetical protein
MCKAVRHKPIVEARFLIHVIGGDHFPAMHRGVAAPEVRREL